MERQERNLSPVPQGAPARENPSRPRLLRVGGIDYLNAQPLLWGLRGREGIQVIEEPPSELARRLRSGELDVALIPVVAYPESARYRIVPRIGISSYGPVRSIRLYHRTPLDTVRRVALDACSRTSALLARLLFREIWSSRPEFSAERPARLREALARPDPAAAPFDAALLIGDAALGSAGYPGWDDVDLGTEWTRWTGLPFVYAFWVLDPARAPLPPERITEMLEEARSLGTARIDDIVSTASLPPDLASAGARHYLSRVIHYELGEDKLDGLRLFFARLGAAGLLEAAPEVRFLEPAPERAAAT